MSLSEDATQLASLLLCLTQPDTVAIRNAEATLKPILKDERCLPALFEILAARGTQPDAVRHVAAILLRKRVSGHYDKLPAEYKTKIQADLLALLASEPERTVRNGAVGVAATVCKLECPKEDVEPPAGFVPWPDLFQFISQASQDANPTARELAFLLLLELTDTIANYLASQLEQIIQLFQACMANTQEDLKVKTACVKALGNLMTYLVGESEIDMFGTLLAPILQHSVACQKSHDEDTVSTVLEVLYDMTYSPGQLVNANFGDIIRFSLGCMTDESLDMKVRDSAALVIATLAETKPKTFGKDNILLTSVLDAIFNLIDNSEETGAGALFDNNPAWREDQDEDYDPDEDKSATSIAQGTLDTIACEIPKKYIFQQIVQMCISRLSSPNDNHRKTGVACLGVIAEGCAEPFREHLDEIMPHVLKAATDHCAAVKECVCFALGQISEHCQPEILSYSSQILPIAFALLDDSSIQVQATSCYVLEMFCERLEPDDIRPLLDPLVKKLGSMLETSTKRSVQEMATAAIAATAVAAEEEFVPYVHNVATLMTKMIALQDEKLFSLRGRALECMGHLAIAVGKENFRSYFQQTMQYACDGLTTDSTDLHEFAYALFANLAKVMGDEFSPCLPELVPHLLKVIEQDDGCFEAVERENQELQSLAYLPMKNQFGSLDDSDDEDGEGNFMLQVRTGMLDAKKGAITAIGEISQHCGAAFVPYLDQSVPLLQKSAKNWHPRIKSEVAEVFSSVVASIVAADHGGNVEWTKGDINGTSPLSQRTTVVVTTVLQELCELMKDEDEETVGKACEGIQAIIDLCGPHALVIIANSCLENSLNLLSKKAPCQLSELEDDYDDDDEHESFMTSVCDLVASFAQVMGPHFVQYLPQFLPAICIYMKPARTSSDRGMALGCLGELAQALGDGIKDHWKSVYLPAILSGFAEEDLNVRRNAAFCAGVSFEGLGDFAIGDYGQILQAVSPLFNVDPNASDAAAACLDNATACVARMIMVSPGNVPIPDVLPVMLKSLPLKNDMTENETVYKCLLGLLQMNHPQAIANKDEMKRVFMEAVAEGSKVDDEVKDKLKLTLAGLA